MTTITTTFATTDAGLNDYTLRCALNNGDVLVSANDLRCSIKRTKRAGQDVYEMSGPMGKHALSADHNVTSNARLWKHWVGFKLNNRNA